MNTSQETCHDFVAAVIELSDLVGIPYPMSGEIAPWWSHLLSELDEADVDFLLDKFAGETKGPLFAMKQVVEQRKRELVSARMQSIAVPKCKVMMA